MSKIGDFFKGEKTPEEVEAENALLEAKEKNIGYKLSIAKQEELIKELEARGRKWQEFSNNGKKSGIIWDKVKAFFSTH
jgi:hypothetical protein